MADVLLVCTGNRCRSPVADALMWRALRDRGIDATTTSAGLLEPGAPLPPETVRVLARYGIEGRGHRSRQVTPELITDTTLVVGMERSHVRAVSVLDAAAWHRTFTLKELVRRATGAVPRPFGETLPEWASRLGGDRAPGDMLGESAADDIADPMGLPYPEHARTAIVIEELVERLVDLAWPDAVR
jgi:protein-tyrosine phosphatase